MSRERRILISLNVVGFACGLFAVIVGTDAQWLTDLAWFGLITNPLLAMFWWGLQ